MKLLRTLVFASVWLALSSCASVGRFSASEAATIGAEPGEGAMRVLKTTDGGDSLRLRGRSGRIGRAWPGRSAVCPPEATHALYGDRPGRPGRRDRSASGRRIATSHRRAALRPGGRAVRVLRQSPHRAVCGRNGPESRRMPVDSRKDRHGRAPGTGRAALPGRTERKAAAGKRVGIHGRRIPARDRPFGRNSVHRPDSGPRGREPRRHKSSKP